MNQDSCAGGADRGDNSVSTAPALLALGAPAMGKLVCPFSVLVSAENQIRIAPAKRLSLHQVTEMNAFLA
jgi:hypothetical protein